LRHIAAKHSDDEWVLVHDAARPCLNREALAGLIEHAETTGTGAILALPVSDTLKYSDSAGSIKETVDRQNMWSAQTPQLFKMQELLTSLESALRFGVQPTDEAQAIERAGFPAALVTGSADNIKITRPEDLAIAEAILKRQQERSKA
jgi:2-C-methyl-D-erythritol 4-phosphate cytidylyltransferase